MKDEEMIFSVEFYCTKLGDGGVAVKANGNADFLLSAMSEVLTGIVMYTGCGIEAILESKLGEKVKNITTELAHKAAMKNHLDKMVQPEEPIEEHVLAITPEMEAEAEEEEKRNEQKD